jgi:muramoyltetrapeptide carboxypeptidase
MPIIAPKLNPGDTIGVVSPSSPVTQALEEKFSRGVDYLKGFGYEVMGAEHLRSTAWGYCASPEEKADDINRMFGDDQVKAVICSQGGVTANGCLPYLDWDLIRLHPKIFMGISDISVLLNAIQAKTGLVTFHGNDVIWGFGRKPGLYDDDEFQRVLVQGGKGLILPLLDRRTIRGGSAEGVLLGGNLACMLKLAGTPYFPEMTGAILLLEAFEITPEACDHYFQQMLQMGVFERIAGVVIGYNYSLQKQNSPIQMEDVLLRVTNDFKFPILKSEDFGHNCPNTVLPIGGRVYFDADARTIEVLDNVVF